jgi:hypothetical protein
MKTLIKRILREHRAILKETQKGTAEDFIKKAKEVHGDKYDYSEVDYQSNKEPVTIICPKHGPFKQSPVNHLRGSICRKCDLELRSEKLKWNTDTFIQRAKEVHGDDYDYSKVDYQGGSVPVTIICPKHNLEFKQTPGNHLRGAGCRLCANEKLREKYLMSQDEFIRRAKEIHGDKYDYSQVDYKGAEKKVKIVCPKHGPFLTLAVGHLSRKQGCPVCQESKGEKMTAKVLNSMGVKFIRLHQIEDCVSKSCRKLTFDFYLPDYNALIEYDGEQHFYPVAGRDEQFIRTEQNDKIKNNYTRKNNIPLLRIPFTFNTEELISGELSNFISKLKK